MRAGKLAVAVLLGLVSMAQAAPLNPKQVAADSQWVVHVDVDAVRSSIVVQKAYQAFVDKCPVAKVALPILDKSRELIGMDPRKDLHSITAYGPQVGKHKGVLLICADADQKLLAEKVKKAPGYKCAKYGDYTVHSWVHKDKHGEHPASGACYKEKTMVFAGSDADVKAALDVLDGKKPSLTCKILGAEAPAGTTLLVRAVGISAVKPPCDSQVIKQIDSGCLAMGENQGKSFMNVKIATKSAEVAKEMGKIAEGIRAMGMLHAIDCPNAKPLVESTKISVTDKGVAVECSAPAEAVWAHLQVHMKKAIERHRKMAEWRKAHQDQKGKKADAKKPEPKKEGKKAEAKKEGKKADKADAKKADAKKTPKEKK